MKKSLLLLSAIPIMAFAQLQPTLGIKYTGGLSYEMEHEYISGQIGLMNTFQEGSIFDNVSLSGEYVYDYMQEFDGKHNFYVIRLQSANNFAQNLSLTYYGGYINNFKKDLMQPFSGSLKTNLAWGGGIRYNSDFAYAELMYENLAGYPHISLGLHFKLWQLNRK